MSNQDQDRQRRAEVRQRQRGQWRRRVKYKSMKSKRWPRGRARCLQLRERVNGTVKILAIVIINQQLVHNVIKEPPFLKVRKNTSLAKGRAPVGRTCELCSRFLLPTTTKTASLPKASSKHAHSKTNHPSSLWKAQRNWPFPKASPSWQTECSSSATSANSATFLIQINMPWATPNPTTTEV